MTNTVPDNKTMFMVKNVDASLAATELAQHLGLPVEALTLSETYSEGGGAGTVDYLASVGSLDEAMVIFCKHNFRTLRGRCIMLVFRPRHIYNRIPELEFATNGEVSMKEIYDIFSRFGTVVSVFSSSSRREYNYSVHFATKECTNAAYSSIRGKHTMSIGRERLMPRGMRNVRPMDSDFWRPPPPVDKNPPPKAKGNLIGVPTNFPQNRLTAPKPIGSKPTLIAVSPSLRNGVSPSTPRLSEKPNARPLSPPPLQQNQKKKKKKQEQSTHSINPIRITYLSQHDRANYLSDREQRAHYHLRNSLSPVNTVDPSHVIHPGALEGRRCGDEETDSFRGTRGDWYDTAFICYESLYNQSSTSAEGRLSMSTLAWGSQLDISTFRLHYGSLFVPTNETVEMPVASSMTVEIRQYGDKESAAEVLAIRNEGQMPMAAKAMKEGANVKARGPIMSMKCLESGHLVTSCLTASKLHTTLFVWDMKGDAEEAKVPLAKLATKQSGLLWIDAKGMDVCSVDSRGTINSYDLYKAVNSYRGPTTKLEYAALDYERTTTIDDEYPFHSTCISLNASDSTILVGSGEIAQIARWDKRSPAVAAITSYACRPKDSSKNGLQSFDPIYGIEWNPLKSNEFMTIHPHTIRVWDTRKMDVDSYATFHTMGNDVLRKAQWSPHRADTIAGLTVDGRTKIWKLNKFDGPADPTTLEQNPEPLFVHRGQELLVSDFAWCPYVEDVISTVCPSTTEQAGCIQVWRPRNLYSSDDYGEP
ncbi:hypothetical protein BGX23_004739 [Mortierella sp. AD031]|nr:hypothetical protein BGX23_004739 [Mortierella sp. AD031]